MHLSAEELHSVLLLDLYDAGMEDSIYPESTYRQWAMQSLAKSFVKKFHNDKVSGVRDDAALALFLECNEHCRNFEGVTPRNLRDELIINEMKSIIDDFFLPGHREWKRDIFTAAELDREPTLLNLRDIASHFGAGPGSNIGSPSTDFYTKYVNSTMCHTNEVLPLLFRQAISRDRIWRDVEAFRARESGFELVRGSRLSFAPKSQKISRTICTEPLLNMLFQKGIGTVVERRLQEVFCINLSSQPDHNVALSQIGSVDGSFGTIDLSSASDSISIAMLRDILPRQPLEWLLRCRSPFTMLPDGQAVELHMISSMGNGFTFPLQTMIFSALVTAAYRICGIKIHKPRERAHGNFAVFGDDIIVDHRVYDAVVDVLVILGFRVNRDKSFNEGFFRESCGSDFYRGRNIRGVYLQVLQTPGDVYSVINRLNRWSARHEVPLHRAVSSLRRVCRFLGIPYDEGDDAGIKVPFELLRRPKFDQTGAVVYHALVNRPRVVRIPSLEAEQEATEKSIASVRVKLPNFRYSSDGLLFCFLAGYLRGGKLGLRVSSPTSVLKQRVCPGWDERIAASGVSQERGERWKLFTRANLVT